MLTTVHSKIKETPFERHYGRKPRTELFNFSNVLTDNYKHISVYPETLQFYSFNKKRGYDQLIMKTRRRLKCDNLLSRRVENKRVMDGQFIQMSLHLLDTEEDEEEESHSQTEDRKESTPARETSTEQMDASIDFTPPTPIGGGKPKPIRNCSPKSPGASNLKLHVNRLTEQQLEQALETVSEDPPTITIVDYTGNEKQIKTEVVEIPNTNETNNNNNQIKRSSKI